MRTRPQAAALTIADRRYERGGLHRRVARRQSRHHRCPGTPDLSEPPRHPPGSARVALPSGEPGPGSADRERTFPRQDDAPLNEAAFGAGGGYVLGGPLPAIRGPPRLRAGAGAGGGPTNGATDD